VRVRSLQVPTIGSETASQSRPSAKITPTVAGAISSTSVAKFRKKNWTKNRPPDAATTGAPHESTIESGVRSGCGRGGAASADGRAGSTTASPWRPGA
jgi:hypothetical protein